MRYRWPAVTAAAAVLSTSCYVPLARTTRIRPGFTHDISVGASTYAWRWSVNYPLTVRGFQAAYALGLNPTRSFGFDARIGFNYTRAGTDPAFWPELAFGVKGRPVRDYNILLFGELGLTSGVWLGLAQGYPFTSREWLSLTGRVGTSTYPSLDMHDESRPFWSAAVALAGHIPVLDSRFSPGIAMRYDRFFREEESKMMLVLGVQFSPGDYRRADAEELGFLRH